MKPWAGPLHAGPQPQASMLACAVAEPTSQLCRQRLVKPRRGLACAVMSSEAWRRSMPTSAILAVPSSAQAALQSARA